MKNKIDKSRLLFVGFLMCLSFGVVSLSGCYLFETKPYAPSDLLALSLWTDKILLSWQDNSDNEDGFYIYRKSGQAWLWIDDVGRNEGTYYDTDLNAGTTYYYKVKAYNGAGSSGFSNEASATTWR